MTMSRILRSISVGLLFVAAGAVAFGQGGAAQTPPALPKLNKIADDIYMIENQDVTPDALRYWGGNITLQITNDGVIMVDAKYSRAHDDVVAKINTALKQALKDPEFIKKEQALGAVVVTDKRVEPAEHRKFVQAEIDKWGPIIKAAGVYAD